MKKSETQLLARIGVILQFLLGSSFVFGQVVGETKTIEITVDDPRPLAAAILKLQELSGIPINYEDMPVYYSGDQQERIPRYPDGRSRFFGARGGQLSQPIVVDAATGRLNNIQAVSAALTALVSAYNTSNLPGGFDFEYYNGVFFVKPVRYRDATGATQTMAPILSTPITFPEELRSWNQTWRLILRQVAGATTVEIFQGMGLDGGGTVTLGAQDEPARYVIARYLASGSGPAVVPRNATWDLGMSYRLLCQPQKGCALNVQQVANSPRWAVPSAKPYSPPPRRPFQGVPPAGRRSAP